MELLGNTQILRQQAAALGMNPKDTLICVLKASILVSTGTYVSYNYYMNIEQFIYDR
jgi:hypothetical protein